MKLPNRKNIRLTDYDYSQNGAYFITICVKNKHEILGKIVGDDAYIVPHTEYSEYGNIVNKHIKGISHSYANVIVDKYAIMPNHIHMLIFLNQRDENGTMRASSPTKPVIGIPGIVRSLKTLITKECGFSFWQRGYHDHIIRNETEYQKVWQYIDENPVKWAEDEYYCGNG